MQYDRCGATRSTRTCRSRAKPRCGMPFVSEWARHIRRKQPNLPHAAAQVRGAAFIKEHCGPYQPRPDSAASCLTTTILISVSSPSPGL